MALMYIDTRDQRPLPRQHEPWRPNLRPLMALAVAVVLLAVSPLVSPLASYVLILCAGVLITRTFARLIPSSNGLEDHRQ